MPKAIMIYINITNFVLISWLEKDHSIVELCHWKNVIIFTQTILSFVLSMKIINIYNISSRKYGNVTVKGFRKYENHEYKKNKLKLDINFLNNCKQLGVYPQFLIFKLPNVSSKDALSICKRLLHRAINKHNKELQHFSKKLSLSEIFLSKQLSTIDFYILTKSISSHNKKSYTILLLLNFTICNIIFHYLCPNYQHLLLSWLHFFITSSLYNTPCNRLYNNCLIDICPGQLWFI